MTTQTEELKLALEELAVRFSEGWHEGIKIDASDIMLLNEAAQALAQPAVAEQHKQELTNLERHERNVQQLFGTQQPKETEQEPFGWYSKQEDEFMTHKIRKEHERLNNYTHKVGKFDLPLYTTPPPVPEAHKRKWVGLTKKDMDWLHENTPCIEGNYGYRFIKAIEAKLKEKNT